jgi:hypothetical protein
MSPQWAQPPDPKKARAGLKFERQANHSDCADFARAERRGAQETQCCDPSEMVGRQRRQGDFTATGEKCWFMAATLVAQACRLLYAHHSRFSHIEERS